MMSEINCIRVADSNMMQTTTIIVGGSRRNRNQKVGWLSGQAKVRNTFYSGSNPFPTSIGMAQMKKGKTIIIHSKVSYGYVGSNTTSLVLQMKGYDIINIPTVLYSNHLGYPTAGGGVVADELFAAILEGIEKLGILHEITGIITGYMGTAAQVERTAKWIREIKRMYPRIQYLCDPVMGDTDKGLYVSSEIPDAIVTHLIPLADILTPNQFEAERIVKRPIQMEREIIPTLQEQFNLLKQRIIITGCRLSTTEPDSINTCVVKNASFDIITTKKINLHPPGTGELFTAHLYLLLLEKAPIKKAVQKAGDLLSTVLCRMAKEKREEFELSDISYSINLLQKQMQCMK